MKDMKLKSVKISKYKSFLTEQNVIIEDGVTRLVGKNESGKTAFLEALAKFNYFLSKDTSFKFDKTPDYPRNELKSYEQQNPENNHEVITCVFELNNDLISKIKADVGDGVFNQTTITMSRQYNGKNIYHDLKASIPVFIKHFLSKFAIPSDKMDNLEKCTTMRSLYKDLVADPELKAVADSLKTNYIDKISNSLNGELGEYIEKQYISPNLPVFWYFDEYYILPPQISLNKFKNKKIDVNFTQEQYDISEALFLLAGVDVSKLITDNNHEAFISELEATSNNITDQFLEYWSTNNNLEIQFEIQAVTDDKLLNIRIKNTKHRVTLPLKNRSKGFVWFFSFLVWFSKIESNENVIILLDEPGLNLHADAQNDLLRYIDEKIAKRYQVIYTTHSPFMIDPTKLHEVRTVYDSNDAKIGSIISDAIEEKDKATLFPLQAALGYDIAQNLYISPKNLLVEGVADLVYLTLISDKLRVLKKPYLNDDITIVPVGGLDKVATFISLLRGNELKIACLLDTFIDQKGKARMDDLIRDKIINASNIIFFDEFTPPIKPSEIEDMFFPSEYITLFNNEFTEHCDIDVKRIDPNNSITKQITKQIGEVRFNHYRPAKYLSKNVQHIETLSDETLERFSKAFTRVNKSLE
ncbi:AAA family ATPase [Dehalococcoides mccartyi]|uniref:AAA family ATPase n=1 Tax=Dehalococcoides mccartyi TaxID=61435 RepID=UPI00398A61CE